MQQPLVLAIISYQQLAAAVLQKMVMGAEREVICYICFLVFWLWL